MDGRCLSTLISKNDVIAHCRDPSADLGDCVNTGGEAKVMLDHGMSVQRADLRGSIDRIASVMGMLSNPKSTGSKFIS